MTAGTSSGPFTPPAYGDRSLADVVPSVARALGVELDGHPAGLELPPAPSYVLFLVDGMGAELLARHAHVAPYLTSLVAEGSTGTAGVPSTTATSLTSLGTGLVPGAHGLVGFTARIPGTDRLLNHLWWDKGVDPEAWQPHPTAFGRLARAGVHVTSVNKRDFAGSGLTVASQRGATYVGADRVGERIAATVSASAHEPSLTYVYDSDLDWTGHKFGVASTQWLQHTAYGIAQDVAVTALKRLHHDFGVTGADGFYIDNTWLQQAVLHAMSFSLPSARYTDKADGISENARSLRSGRETGH